MFSRLIMFIFIVSFVSCASKQNGASDHHRERIQNEKSFRIQR
jgi:hypothetical protein